MKDGIKETIDDRGRLVHLRKSSSGTIIETYYIGRDCEGPIKHEDGKEYIDVDGQRRYWGGIIDPLPDDQRIRLLNEFTVFIIKPDGMKMEIGKAVSHLIKMSGGNVVAEHDFVYDNIMIRKMYPHFFAKEWEQDLFDYLKSGVSRCFLVRGKHPHRNMFLLRNAIRHLFSCNKDPRVKSVVHCAQRQSDAIKQALLFFSLEEVVTLVGLKKSKQ